jgi:ribosomal protein S18 acetylase RimI-like enzyme
MNVHIRPAGPADASAVVRLVQELAQTGGWQSPLDEAYARHYLSSPGSQILLAEKDGEILGLLSYSQRPNLFHAGQTALIEELIVAEGGRSQGVGGALMEYLLPRLEKDGFAEVSVSTMLDNAGAIRFYKSHGLVDEALFLEKHFQED